MGTANYARYFFKNVYSIDELDEDFVDEQLQDVHDLIFSELQLKLKKVPGAEVSMYDGEYINSRHGGGRVFGNVYLYTGLGEPLLIELLVLNGYYQGLNFDIRLKGNYYSDYVDGIDDMINNSYNYERDRNLTNTEEKRISKKINRIIDIIEKVYSNNTDKKIVLGVFSNGEAVYKSVSDIIK